jgi:hypothetical protein
MGEAVAKPRKTVPITPQLSFIVAGSRKSSNVVSEVLPGMIVTNDQTLDEKTFIYIDRIKPYVFCSIELSCIARSRRDLH